MFTNYLCTVSIREIGKNVNGGLEDTAVRPLCIDLASTCAFSVDIENLQKLFVKAKRRKLVNVD